MDIQYNFQPKQKNDFKAKIFLLIVMGVILLASSGVFSSDKIGGKEAEAEEEPPKFPFVKQIEEQMQIGTSTVMILMDPPPPALSAGSFLSVFSYGNGKSKILAEKEPGRKMPLASVTKLMTALIAYPNISPEREIIITKDIIKEEDSSLKFWAGDSFTFRDLFFAMLIESNNDAANAFAVALGKDNFMKMMNAKAAEIGMKNTYYGNPTGLDPNMDREPIINFSTAEDLFALAEYILENQPEIFPITTLKEYDIYKLKGGFNHKAQTTNKLLEFGDTLACAGKPIKILGGKTGSTDLARKNLLIITESPIENSHIINIVLGADNHFADMTSLIDWVCQNYNW